MKTTILTQRSKKFSSVLASDDTIFDHRDSSQPTICLNKKLTTPSIEVVKILEDK